MRKKFVTFLLAVSMVLSTASCAKGSEEKSKAGDGQTAKAEVAVGETAVGETAEKPGQGPEQEEAVISAFIMQSATGESGIWQGWGAKKLYDDLKIKVDFDPTGNETETKLQQYLVAGELPDFVGLQGLDQAELVMDAEMLLPLDEYKEQLPNLFNNEAYADAIKYSQDNTGNGTGHLYIMPVAIGPAAYNSFNWVPLLQWDAYKQIGMLEISTLEDYLDVAEQMVAYKPTTESGEKVYGFSLFSDWDKVSAVEISTLSFMYGIDSEYVSTLMETNILTKETKSLLADDSFYKRALKFYYEANQRGLLDPDSMSQTYSDVESKFSAGRVMFSWFDWLTGSYNTPENQNNAEKVDGMARIVAKDMKLYNAPNQTIGRNWYFAISKDCPDLDAALKLMNWLYDPEVQAYLYNGPQGVTWDYNEKGEPEVTDWDILDNFMEIKMPEEVGGGAFQDGKYSFNILGLQPASIMENGYTISQSYWPSSLERNPSLMKKEVDEKLQDGISIFAEYLYENDMVAESTQAVNMITPASDGLEITTTQIGEIVKKFSWQMVYAEDEAEFESLWETMTGQAKELGLDEVTAYYTAEWERALELVKDYE